MEIDTDFFLSKEVMEDIVKIRPNATGIIGTAKTIERGVSNMICLPRRMDEIEDMMLKEEAAEMSVQTRSLRDAQGLLKGLTHAPPACYGTLKANVTT